MKITIDPTDSDTYVVSKLNNQKYTRITHTHLKKYNMSLSEYCEKYNLSKTDIICKKLRDKLPFTKENCISRYGEEKGLLKWDQYCKKQAYTNSYEYKNKKYGMTENEFNLYNKNRAATLDNFIKRHGEVDGLNRWKNYCETQSKSGCSLEYFIEKYGDKKGRDVYDNVCKSKSTSMASYISKYGIDEGTKRYNSLVAEKMVGYSKISQELFRYLSSYTDNKVYFAESHYGTEYHVLDVENSRSYFYDYVDIINKKCIEFNGDVFHGNPEMFTESDTPNPFLKVSCSEIWAYDKDKINHLKMQRGIDTLVVWERDYRENKQNVIEKCLQFLEYEY